MSYWKFCIAINSLPFIDRICEKPASNIYNLESWLSTSKPVQRTREKIAGENEDVKNETLEYIVELHYDFYVETALYRIYILSL